MYINNFFFFFWRPGFLKKKYRKHNLEPFQNGFEHFNMMLNSRTNIICEALKRIKYQIQRFLSLLKFGFALSLVLLIKQQRKRNLAVLWRKILYLPFLFSLIDWIFNKKGTHMSDDKTNYNSKQCISISIRLHRYI